MGNALPKEAGARAKPEKTEVRLGFMPLTDCAPLVIAALKGFDRRHGIRIQLSREASWAAIRDKLLSGENDASHALYGLIYGLHMGVGGLQRDMAIPLCLSRNGQGITLSRQLQDQGVRDGATLAHCVAQHRRQYSFAQTFPTGTHAMWLYYWLAAHGVHPFEDVRNTTIPPPQMVAQMRAGHVQGYCVGEPWNARAVFEGIGFTVATSQQIWPDHPEKVLGMSAEFVTRHPDTARAVTAAVLEAARWCDAQVNRAELAEILAGSAIINTDLKVIQGRLQGEYEDGLGRRWQDSHALRFFSDGEVNHPWLSDGMWFLTQLQRWGLLREAPDYRAVAEQIHRIDLYREACTLIGIHAPAALLRSSRLMDGKVWDGESPAAYADSFAIRR